MNLNPLPVLLADGVFLDSNGHSTSCNIMDDHAWPSQENSPSGEWFEIWRNKYFSLIGQVIIKALAQPPNCNSCLLSLKNDSVAWSLFKMFDPSNGWGIHE